MDARPLFPKYVVPILNRAKIYVEEPLVNWATETIRDSKTDKFGKVENGLIATGDKFIADKSIFIYALFVAKLPPISGVLESVFSIYSKLLSEVNNPPDCFPISTLSDPVVSSSPASTPIAIL